MMNVTRFCALCVPLSVRTLLLVCRGTSTGSHAAAAVASSCTSNDAIVRDAGLLVWAATDVDGARLAFFIPSVRV